MVDEEEAGKQREGHDPLSETLGPDTFQNSEFFI